VIARIAFGHVASTAASTGTAGADEKGLSMDAAYVLQTPPPSSYSLDRHHFCPAGDGLTPIRGCMPAAHELTAQEDLSQAPKIAILGRGDEPG
jgi:hypothetical protein